MSTVSTHVTLDQLILGGANQPPLALRSPLPPYRRFHDLYKRSDITAAATPSGCQTSLPMAVPYDTAPRCPPNPALIPRNLLSQASSASSTADPARRHTREAPACATERAHSPEPATSEVRLRPNSQRPA